MRPGDRAPSRRAERRYVYMSSAAVEDEAPVKALSPAQAPWRRAARGNLDLHAAVFGETLREGVTSRRELIRYRRMGCVLADPWLDARKG